MRKPAADAPPAPLSPDPPIPIFVARLEVSNSSINDLNVESSYTAFDARARVLYGESSARAERLGERRPSCALRRPPRLSVLDNPNAAPKLSEKRGEGDAERSTGDVDDGAGDAVPYTGD